MTKFAAWIAIAVVLIAVTLTFVSYTLNGSNAGVLVGCTEPDHPDRRLPHSYRLRVMSFCAYRVKLGPDHVVLPTTGAPGWHHGILQVAVLGDIVIGPVLDFRTDGTRPLIGWFILDTEDQSFVEKLTIEEIDARLKALNLSRPLVLTPVENLDEIAP